MKTEQPDIMAKETDRILFKLYLLKTPRNDREIPRDINVINNGLIIYAKVLYLKCTRL